MGSQPWLSSSSSDEEDEVLFRAAGKPPGALTPRGGAARGRAAVQRAQLRSATKSGSPPAERRRAAAQPRARPATAARLRGRKGVAGAEVVKASQPRRARRRNRPQSALSYRDAAVRRVLRARAARGGRSADDPPRARGSADDALADARELLQALYEEAAEKTTDLKWEVRVSHDMSLHPVVRTNSGRGRHRAAGIVDLADEDPERVRRWLAGSRFVPYADGGEYPDWAGGNADTDLLHQWCTVRRHISGGIRKSRRAHSVLHLDCCNGLLLRCLMEWCEGPLVPFGVEECAALVDDRSVGRVLPQYFRAGHFLAMSTAEFVRLILAPPEPPESDSSGDESVDSDDDSYAARQRRRRQVRRRMEKRRQAEEERKEKEAVAALALAKARAEEEAAAAAVVAEGQPRPAEGVRGQSLLAAHGLARHDLVDDFVRSQDAREAAIQRRAAEAKEEVAKAKELQANTVENPWPHCAEAMRAGLGPFPRTFDYILVDAEELVPDTTVPSVSSHFLARLVRLLSPNGRLLLMLNDATPANEARIKAFRATGFKVHYKPAGPFVPHLLAWIESDDRPSSLVRRLWFKRLFAGAGHTVRVAVGAAVHMSAKVGT